MISQTKRPRIFSLTIYVVYSCYMYIGVKEQIVYFYIYLIRATLHMAACDHIYVSYDQPSNQNYRMLAKVY